uniref:Photosystem I reaction center subunit II, chloroplastic n=1 Tax=Wollemia nobilis TaxID=56998 RepID=A0A0C9RRU1_9CONI
MAMALRTTAAAAASAPSVAAAANPATPLQLRATFAPWKTTPFQRISSSRPPLVVMAAEAEATKTAETEPPKGFTPPELKTDTPSPIFGGSTGGLLRKAQLEEFYVITWESPKEQIFEMPTAGAAIMREGPNLLKLARKEQCLALGTRLRSKYKINYQFYRVFPNGEVQYLHPKDGVYPEKANPGRKGVGLNMRNIGKNINPIEVKFTGKQPYDV